MSAPHIKRREFCSVWKPRVKLWTIPSEFALLHIRHGRVTAWRWKRRHRPGWFSTSFDPTTCFLQERGLASRKIKVTQMKVLSVRIRITKYQCKSSKSAEFPVFRIGDWLISALEDFSVTVVQPFIWSQNHYCVTLGKQVGFQTLFPKTIQYYYGVGCTETKMSIHPQSKAHI